MRSLSKEQIQAISDVVKLRKTKVSDNAKWRAIVQFAELHDVEINKKYIFFSAEHRQKLRQSVIDQNKFDPMYDDFNDDRIGISVKTNNDKLAGIRPEDDFVLVKWLSIEVGGLALSRLSSLRMPICETLNFIKQQNITSVLVVENLDIFSHIDDFSLPLGANPILVVYRGGGAHSSAGSTSLLSNGSQAVKVIYFGDFDPEGLKIGLTMKNVSHFVFPELAFLTSKTKKELNEISFVDDYRKQHRATKFISGQSLNNETVKHLNFIRQNELSIKQQHMLAHKLPLILVRR
ncbi:MAG: DUF7281 domain-containing protein [Parashewanella sp.]